MTIKNTHENDKTPGFRRRIFIYDQIRKKHPKIKEKVGIVRGLFPIYPTIGIQKGVLQNLQARPAFLIHTQHSY